MRKISPAEIATIMSKSDRHRVHVVGRALKVLFLRQTQDERIENDTKCTNMRGFQQCDAKQGCIQAKYYIKHGTLQPWMLDRWTRPNAKGLPYITKYHRQLSEEARA